MQIPKYFATKNLNKLREVNQILGLTLEHVALELVEIQSLSLQEVVCAKAQDAYQKFGKPVLVEDTSFEFEAWKGLPGPLIKWFLESVNLEGILKMLAGESNRRAVAKSAFAFFDGQVCQTFIGEVKGMIAENLRGDNGFEWDRFFIPDGYAQTYAEMSQEQKNSISMRRAALVDIKKHS